MKNNNTYIAIDYGLKRVGFAIYHANTDFVFPLCTLDRSIKKTFFENLTLLVEKHKPTAFIVGLPLHDDGSPCITTSQVKNFANSLLRRYPIPLYFMEELLSSFDAEHDMRSMGLSAKKIKEKVDQEAAVKILESFLLSSTQKPYIPQKELYPQKNIEE